MKKFRFLFTAFLISVGVLLTPLLRVSAQDIPDVNVYLFYSTGCPHCKNEIAFLEGLTSDRQNINVVPFEVSKSRKNALFMKEVADLFNADANGVPFTVIGTQYFVGFGSAETTGKELISAIEKVELGKDKDIIAEKYMTEEEPANNSAEPAQNEKPKEGKEVDLGVFGVINSASVSLPLITIMIALVDGFNPCAMWVLVFLISMLLGYKDRKRMWILGTTFIAASAFVYFLFMVAWLKLFMFFGYLNWIRLGVGVLALYLGYRNLRGYFSNKDGGCEVTSNEKRVEILNRIKDITKKENIWLAAGGIVILAFAVNLIEAVCSAGLPAVYTQILALNDLPAVKYYLYIILYQVVFMLDDMAVFALAMITLNSVGIESKYVRWTRIFGAMVMVVIGLLLIFKPELLFFG